MSHESASRESRVTSQRTTTRDSGLGTRDSLYALLRHLTLPVVAITTSAEGRRNAMIANSAQRASLVPAVPRISVYISKTNLTHDLVYGSGVLGIHLLRRDQWELIWRLGLYSGRDTDKLGGVDVRTGDTGCPMLVDVLAAFECRVVNAMDAGGSTFFLGDVVAAREGAAGDVMTSEYFRKHMSEERRRTYEAKLIEAQKALASMSHVERKVWPGPIVGA
ncbi:MAG: flavin reductase family protein [Longimicrobiales bacterium]